MNAVIYARYSSDNQREESIDAQIRAATEYAERNGYKIINKYVDQAKTATSDNRPQFQKMIHDSTLGTFQCIIVHKLDRFARDRYDSAFYKRELKRNNVSLLSVLENIDNSPESIILESVLEGMAEYYSKNLAREVMKGMRETALQCKHTGGIPPLGYDVGADRQYVINQTEAEAIKFIFNQYSAGYGYKPIIAALKEKGHKTKLGRDFTQASLHDILRNEKYTGVYIFNRASSKVGGKRNNHRSKDEPDIIKIPGGMPSIVSEELFAAIQTKMKNNKMNAQNKAKEIYLLSGKILCGKCGAAMIGHTSHAGRNKSKYSTYSCGTRYRTKNCTQKAINKRLVEDIVIADLQQKIFNTSTINRLANKLIEHYYSTQADKKKDILIFEQRLADTQKKLDNFINAIADGLYNSSMKATMDKLEQEKADILIIITEYQTKLKSASLDKSMVIAYLEKDIAALKNKNPDDLKKIIQTYVEKVVVYEEYVEVFLVLFVHMIGGGEENRTPVQRHYCIGFSERSR